MNDRLIRPQEERNREPGRYEVAWRGEDYFGARVPAGVYFLRLNAPGMSQTRKMLRID